jgi:hypothetical protein
MPKIEVRLRRINCIFKKNKKFFYIHLLISGVHAENTRRLK